MVKLIAQTMAGDPTDKRFIFMCPGCNAKHAVRVSGKDPIWKFNGDVVKPTFSPSLLVHPSWDERRCHSWIKDGMIQFLDDCSHQLQGQTVEIPDAVSWFKGSING